MNNLAVRTETNRSISVAERSRLQALEPAGLNFRIIVDKDVPIAVDRFPSEIAFSLANIEIIALTLLGQIRSVNDRDGMVLGAEDFREGLDFLFVGQPSPRTR